MGRLLARRSQRLLEPLGRQAPDLLQRAGLLEQVRGARDHLEVLARSPERPPCILVQLQDPAVVPTHDKEGGRLDLTERGPREIGAAAARDEGADRGRAAARGDERGRRAGAGA